MCIRDRNRSEQFHRADVRENGKYKTDIGKRFGVSCQTFAANTFKQISRFFRIEKNVRLSQPKQYPVFFIGVACRRQISVTAAKKRFFLPAAVNKKRPVTVSDRRTFFLFGFSAVSDFCGDLGAAAVNFPAVRRGAIKNSAAFKLYKIASALIVKPATAEKDKRQKRKSKHENKSGNERFFAQKNHLRT